MKTKRRHHHRSHRRRRIINNNLTIFFCVFITTALLLIIFKFNWSRKPRNPATNSQFIMEDEEPAEAPEVETVLIFEEDPKIVEPEIIEQDRNIPKFDLNALPNLKKSSFTTGGAIPTSLTPLQALKSGQQSRVYELILQRIALDEVDPGNGYNLLHYLARSYNYKALEHLLGLDDFKGRRRLDSQCKNGDTPLHLALQHPNRLLAVLLTHQLILYDADPTIPNNDQVTPEQLAKRDLELDFVVNRKSYQVDERVVWEGQYFKAAFGGMGPPPDPFYCYGMEPG